MRTVYTEARIYRGGRFDEGSLAVEQGRIVPAGTPRADDRVVSLRGLWVVPGLVDVHVHLREPGFPQKETIATGTAAAARGGYTAVCSMPNLNPAPDSLEALHVQTDLIRRDAVVRVLPYGCITKGQRGCGTLADLEALAPEVVGFSDDGRGVQDSGMMRRTMDYAKQFDRVVMCHCQDEGLVGAGQVNEGECSTRLGLLGWPAEGEELEIMRDIALCRLTGCHFHAQHVTTARGLELIRAAKAEGLPVTCEVTPHHLFLCEDDITDAYDTNLKMNPPLRTADDAAALREGLLDGSIDCVVTDHAPHAPHEKDCEWEISFFGIVGLETSLPLMLQNLVATGKMSWSRLVEVMAVNPRRLLRLDPVCVKAGSAADLTLIDPAKSVTVTPEWMQSRSKNSAWLGQTLTGVATDVFVSGKRTLADGVVTPQH